MLFMRRKRSLTGLDFYSLLIELEREPEDMDKLE
jgi:hypothetical protein